MGRVWAGSPPLLCRHPGGNPLLSRGDILESWKLIFDRSLAIDVQTQIQSIEIGQDLAWLTALETVRLTTKTNLVSTGRVHVLRIHRREGTGWHLAVHFAIPQPSA